MSIAQGALLVAGAAYSIAGFGFFLEGKPWMAVTMLLYCGACYTIYYGGQA